jgi:hypothetical protein
MSTLFATLLVLHVVTGLIAVFASFAVSLGILKKIPEFASVLRAALLACIMYILSWFSGGWYYWKYYGGVVKTSIMNGDYRWAHAIFTESKEHVFLFLPIASLALYLAIRYMNDEMLGNPALKRSITALSVIVTVIGTIITLSGVLITGGAR